MNVPRSEFLRRYDTDSHSELGSLRLEVERLRDMVETRAQHENQHVRILIDESERRIREATEASLAAVAEATSAMTLEVRRLTEIVDAGLAPDERLMHALSETLEPRIRFSAQEAIAYSAQRMDRMEATLRALGRRFAEFARQAEPEAALEERACEAGAYVMGPAGEDAQGARRLSLSGETEQAFVRDAANLPIPPGGASRLVAAQVIEHIAPAALEARVLPHWRSRLMAGGELVVVTRDGPAFLADLATRGDFASQREALFAFSAPALRNLLDEALLVALLTRAGFAPQAPTRGDGFVLRVVAHA